MTKTVQASVSKYCTLDNGLYTTECIEFANKQRTLMSLNNTKKVLIKSYTVSYVDNFINWLGSFKPLCVNAQLTGVKSRQTKLPSDFFIVYIFLAEGFKFKENAVLNGEVSKFCQKTMNE